MDTKALFDQLLDTVPTTAVELEISDAVILPPEEWEKLQTKMPELRKQIQAGHQATKEEQREIVVYFRARRGRNFTFEKPKKEKVKAAKKALPAKKKKQTETDLSTLLEKLGL